MGAFWVVGLGNPMRQDDGLGPRVIELLQHLRPHWPLKVMRGDAAGLLELLPGLEGLVVIDALISGMAPGTLLVRDCSTQPLPATLKGASTHALGVAQALELARMLDQLPPVVWVFGVEALWSGHGEGLSPPVEASIPALLDALTHLLDPRLGGPLDGIR